MYMQEMRTRAQGMSAESETGVDTLGRERWIGLFAHS